MRQNRRGRNRGMMRKGIGGKNFDNGGEVRVRGNVHQLLERYLQLARDAGTAGDRVAAENYLQHAEHYYRVINEAGMNNRPRFNGRDLSVAAVDVQHPNAGLSTSFYGNAAIAPQEGGEVNGTPSQDAAAANNDQGDQQGEDQPSDEESSFTQAAEEEAAAPAKRRAPRGRGRPRLSRSETVE